MSAYDFQLLSDYDFEALVGDLISAELSLPLELFAPGRDKGIDLRHFAPDQSGTIIVQCKHYVRSGFATLLTQVKKELPKIDKLKPQRYCLATSVPLTPDRKSKLMAAVSPHIRSPGDIWGQDELNAMIRQRPDIEKAHFKLWLTSTAVLSALLNHEILGRSTELLEDISAKAALYVQNASFPEAKRLLDEHHICFVSGEPGVGKTTLAEMLLLDAAARAYQVIVISEDVLEAERVYDHRIPQIFYYDDFLGQASTAEKLRKNEDRRLVSFMNRVQKSNNKLFLLTTREYMLQDARLGYEKLFHSELELYKYILDLQSYTRFERAKILYSHLFFAGLPRAALDSLLEGDRYLRLIDHSNYSPRLIEHVVRQGRREQLRADFFDFAKGALDRPERLWLHAFENQLDDMARAILLVMVTMRGRVFLDDVSQAVVAFGSKDTPATTISNLKNALKVLEGSFTRTRVGVTGMTVSLLNPSVRDFVVAYLRDHPDLVRKLVSSATFFEQCQYLFGLSNVNIGDQGRLWSNIASVLSAISDQIVVALRRTFTQPSCTVVDLEFPGIVVLAKQNVDYESRAIFVLRLLSSNVPLELLLAIFSFLAGRWAERQGSKSSLIQLLAELQILSPAQQAVLGPYLVVAKNWLFTDLHNPNDYAFARALGESSLGLVGVGEMEQLSADLNVYVDDVLDRIDDLDDDEYADMVTQLRDALGGFCEDGDERYSFVQGRLAELEDEGSEPDEDYLYDQYRESVHGARPDTEDIQALFGSLRERD